jgi:hypothetical protein
MVSLLFLYTPFAYAAGTLAVTNVFSDKTYARAGGGFSEGWKWTLTVSVPNNEPVLRMKFGNFTAAGSSFSPVGNVRFYAANSSNASTVSSAVLVGAIDTYGGVLNLPRGATTTSIVMEVRVPTGAVSGSYSAPFGIQTLPDTEAPVLSLVGASSIIIERGSVYTELGATATDNIDGSFATSSVAVSGSVAAASIGSYILTYSVSDAAGNAAVPITRTVVVRDTIAPTGSVSYSTTIPTNQNVIAELTPSEPVIFTNQSGIATTTSGTATTTFTQNGSFAFLFADVGQNTGSTTATVGNIDKVAPLLTAFSLNGGSEDVAVNITSTSVAIALTASESVNWLSLKIENQSNTAVYKLFQSGSLCVDWTTTCNKTWNGSLSQGALSDGVYRVRVRARDAAGNEYDDYLSKNIVVDTTAPVITLSGSATLTHNLGAVYSDAGASASDTRDGSVVVVSSGTVNVNTVGDYTITYTATDAVGNTATATRTVQVIPVLVTSITVSASGGATTVPLNGTLQMSVAVLPDNATNKSVTWIVVCDNTQIHCVGGQLTNNHTFTGGGTISSTGVLTGTWPDRVQVKATAADGSGVSHTITICVLRADGICP